MYNQTQPARADALQADKQGYENHLEGTITICQIGTTYQIIGRFMGKIYRVYSQSQARATLYAREWLALNKNGGMY